ncbi:hypothetical protein HY641_01995 [Candidatus Woesearchaeota archaeon]|nr:hypothetical protein [Candidatus Woesearchaeota archaeon]
MLFQVATPFSQFGSTFANVAIRYGIYDIFLPFLLVFAVVYAITSTMDVFKGKDGKKTNVPIVISLVIALLFIFPHFMGIQPDPVTIINNAIPSITVLAIAFVLLMILLGLFGLAPLGGILQTLAAIISVLAVGYFFLLAAGYQPLQWFGYYFPILLDPQLQDLIVILLVFGVIVYFVVSDEGTTDTRPYAERQEAARKFLFGK